MRGTRPGKAALGGIRLPHESPGVGDGYCASGECITRQMTEAERQRYGKAEPSGKQPFVWRKKEDGEVSRLDVAREKLTKEKYLELKKAGMLDGEIMRKYFGSVWADVLNALKKEWGLVGALPNPGNAKKKEEITQAVKVDIEKPKAEPAAIELFDSSKTKEEHLEDMLAIQKMQPDLRTAEDTFLPDKAIYQRNVTALDAADEFYTLQEDLGVLDDEISKLTKERVHITDRMQVLKNALEKVTVII